MMDKVVDWRSVRLSVNFSFQSVILLSTVITRETFGHQRFARAHAHKSRIHADKRFLDEGLINAFCNRSLVIIHSRSYLFIPLAR